LKNETRQKKKPKTFFVEKDQRKISQSDPCGDRNGNPISLTDALRAPIQTCFTPQQQCLPLILSEIRRARKEILVQAYSFTSSPMAQALMTAKQRGVNVRVIADKSQETAKTFSDRCGH